MPFTLHFQDPTAAAATLFEVLVEASASAEVGGGMFSFASRHGIELLLKDPDFSQFLSVGSFDLIVGVDAVTAPSALSMLKEASASLAGLEARAFLHERGGMFFYPKLCWFADSDQGRVVVGSGNLTRGGLLKNWEAFGDATVVGDELPRLRAQWSEWQAANATRLLPVDDPGVLERAAKNEAVERRAHEEDEVDSADTKTEAAPPDATVLLAQIPRSDNRWKQANFDLATFRGFFQLSPGTYQRVVLFPVLANGAVGDVEVRQSVSVKSQNYRIELGLASGLDYPEEGPPVGLFLRVGTRRFRYRLLMPGEADYTQVKAFLVNRWTGRADRMKRLVITHDEFVKAFPNIKL